MSSIVLPQKNQTCNMSSLDIIAYVNGEATDAQNSSWSVLSLRVLNPVPLKIE